MSENIQSISQGTFTIGSTSATNFVAGPGIKIDEPSAGTVRIGNDETVLYSGTSNTSPITASEQLSSFEKVEIVWEHNYNNTVVNHFNYTYQMPSNELFAYGGRTGGNGFTWFLAAWTIGNDGKTLTRTQSKYIPITTSVGTPTDNTNLFPIKIIGINRISGGNE